MTHDEFESLVADVGFGSVPEPFRSRIKNVGLTIEDEPSRELRKELGLSDDETLLGFYQGIPQTERGEYYGVGMTLPDTVILFREPILDEAHYTGKTVRKVIEETVWHEIGHHFGLDEEEVERREREMGWHDEDR